MTSEPIELECSNCKVKTFTLYSAEDYGYREVCEECRDRARAMTSEPRFKACPFCKNVTSLELSEISSEHKPKNDGSAVFNIGWIDTKSYHVVCNILKGGCGASGGHRSSRSEALEAWNRRGDENCT